MNDRPDSLEQDLLALLNNEISLDPSTRIGSDTDLLLTGLVDSLGVFDVVAWLEDQLGIGIDPVDIVLENFQTPALMLDYVSRRRREQGRPA